MSIFTRSITFNDLTATISFDTKLNSDNQIDFTVALTSGENKVSTTGRAAMELPDSTSEEPTPVPVPTTDDRANCITTIKNLILDVEITKGKENKAAIAIKLLKYICDDALDFTKSNSRFNDVVVRKCYQFKLENSNIPKLIEEANKTLTKLGASTTIPADFTVDFCSLCGIKHNNPYKAAATVAPVNKKEVYDPDMTLFIALAKKHNAKIAINDPIKYFSYYQTMISWDRCKGSTKAERMESYFSRWSDSNARENLMKSLFTKNNLIFSDSVMTLYYEWVKTYVPVGKTNRYIKMWAFIDANHSLFSAN